MISSMTGFGFADVEDGATSIRIEARSVNNRYLKIKIKNPESLNGRESEIERRIKQKISRGSVTLTISLVTTDNEEPERSINVANLKSYFKMFQQIKEEIGHDRDVNLDSLIALPGVIERSCAARNLTESTTNLIYDTISTAMKKMAEMRLHAGRDIMDEITERCEHIRALLQNVKARIPEMLDNYSSRLLERITKLTKDVDVSITREDLCREIAIFADRSDITEEINLLTSHLGHLAETMNDGAQVGKKLEFIVQEMFRESNTMGSKSNDDIMLQNIFNIKNEVEKIKELVLNVE